VLALAAFVGVLAFGERLSPDNVVGVLLRRGDRFAHVGLNG
jgi:uncharacterized membrane protein